MDTVADLQALDEKYGDQMYKLWGPVLQGFPQDIDTSRQNMFSSNIKQILNPINPEPARITTRYENIFGKYNRSYKKLEGSWRVVEKIPKFSNGANYVYMLVIYNEETDTYDMLERTEAENLVEKFGFLYNNEIMDSLEVGDVIVDDVISKSTSYDEDMNYNLGKNALVMYSTSTETIEDAIFIRQGFADNYMIPEVDSIVITVNDNDILLNLHGDEENYKVLPDVGEIVDNTIVCATRRIVKEKILYAFQTKNMRKLFSTDVPYVATSKNSLVYDINVYYNNDEPFPDNTLFKQLKSYYDDCCVYAAKVYEVANRIKKSGSKYTQNVPHYKSKFQDYNDPEYKWKYRDRSFSNMVIEIKVRSVISLSEGYKLVGRYGDKGVISNTARTDNDVPMYHLDIEDVTPKLLNEELTDELVQQTQPEIRITNDEDMPYLEDGRVIDIILNASGAFRRLNTGQLVEVELNFISEGIRRKLLELDTHEEKVEMIFKYLSFLEKDQYDLLWEYYDSTKQEFKLQNFYGGMDIIIYDKNARERFVQEVEEKGFYLAKYPDSHIRYDTIKALYEEFNFIKPLPIFVDRFQIKGIRCLRDAVVGEKYMYVLKQTTNKQFSARSTGRVDRKNLPQKSADKKNNRSSYSETPIMIGEPYNLWTSVSAATLAKYTLFMRSSPIARKSLKSILAAKGNPFDVQKLEVTETYVNNNAMIFNQYFMGMGCRLHFVTTDKDDIDIYNSIVPISVYGTIIYDIPENKAKYMELYRQYRVMRNRVVENLGDTDASDADIAQAAWSRTLELPEVKDLLLAEGILAMLRDSFVGVSDLDKDPEEMVVFGDDAMRREEETPLEEVKEDTVIEGDENGSTC